MNSKTWEPVEQTFEELKTHLHGRFATLSGDVTAEQKSLQKSVRGLIKSVEDGISAIRDSVGDPVVRSDMAKLGKTMRAALVESFDAAGAQARARLSHEAPAHVKRTAAGQNGGKPRPKPRKTTSKRAPAKKIAS